MFELSEITMHYFTISSASCTVSIEPVVVASSPGEMIAGVALCGDVTIDDEGAVVVIRIGPAIVVQLTAAAQRLKFV